VDAPGIPGFGVRNGEFGEKPVSLISLRPTVVIFASLETGTGPSSLFLTNSYPSGTKVIFNLIFTRLFPKFLIVKLSFA
jgi:hypothetical protein